MKICDYVNEGDGVQHATVKERVRKECYTGKDWPLIASSVLPIK